MMSSPPLVAAPVIETARLRLRPLGLQDVDQSFAMWAEPKVYQFIRGKPKLRAEIWNGIMRHAGQWQLLGFGYWAITNRHTGEFIGEAGFLDIQRDLQVQMPEPEMGWALCTRFHGQGLALEAMQAIASWGDTNLAHSRTACIIDVDNFASRKLAQKLGFIQHTEFTLEDKPILLFHRERRG
jgi:RimJ/RimL family protein N-acetyltransferase